MRSWPRSLAHLALAACMLAAPGCGGPERAGRSPTSPEAAGRLEPLRFLVGDWAGTSATGSFEEHWGEPVGGVMLGTGRELAGGRLSFFELMRIEERDGGGVVLVPQPGGRPGHDFALVESGPGHAAFASDADPRVKRIAYARTGDELVARVVGPQFEAEFRLRRVDRCIGAPRPIAD